MAHGYWGSELSEGEIDKELGARGEELERQGCTVKKIEGEEALCQWTAERIAEGKIAGWFQGRMGSRSGRWIGKGMDSWRRMGFGTASW